MEMSTSEMNMMLEDACPKRKREEGRYSVDCGQPPGGRERGPQHDCYADALAGYLLLPDGTVRSSWLNEDYEWTHESVAHSTKTHYGAVSLKEQMKATERQLCHIKQRFGPAAELCAMACNAQLGARTTASLEFEEARRMCNPFEELGEGRQGGLNNRLFMNRSAIKLANIDAVLDFGLTHCTGNLRFVDLCGAPGGFSEYLMRKSRENGLNSCLGYGMSLQGTNEHGRGVKWKLHHLINNNDGTFIQYRVCNGSDGTGDIYKWENVEALRREILSDAGEEAGKVQLVVADGGFDAQRDSECQEEISQKIVVSQASAALSLLQKGGTFVMKMFGFQTDTIRSLMKSLLVVFGKIQVIKPISSRPASAERYVIFSEYKGVPLLLGACGGSEKVAELQSKLCDCLDECDRDILQLNQKACFQILSYMERKTQTIVHGAATDPSWARDKPRVDVCAYKRDWRL
jgi:cap1 methyltransferase